MFRQLLSRLGPLGAVRGWYPHEGFNIQLISEARCYHLGNGALTAVDMTNASVHAALGPAFAAPLAQRHPDPDAAPVDPTKVYLTFSVTDGDQFTVVSRDFLGASGAASLWSDPARGQIPINWTVNSLMGELARGVLRRYFDEATRLDYFTSDLPAGYAYVTHDFFGDLLDDYGAWVQERRERR